MADSGKPRRSVRLPTNGGYGPVVFSTNPWRPRLFRDRSLRTAAASGCHSRRPLLRISADAMLRRRLRTLPGAKIQYASQLWAKMDEMNLVGQDAILHK